MSNEMDKEVLNALPGESLEIASASLPRSPDEIYEDCLNRLNTKNATPESRQQFIISDELAGLMADNRFVRPGSNTTRINDSPDGFERYVFSLIPRITFVLVPVEQVERAIQEQLAKQAPPPSASEPALPAYDQIGTFHNFKPLPAPEQTQQETT
jgi:hypothetical protein